jgi:predicted acyltransferase
MRRLLEGARVHRIKVQRRFVSLDVFRGAAIVAMILVNNPAIAP